MTITVYSYVILLSCYRSNNQFELQCKRQYYTYRVSKGIASATGAIVHAESLDGKRYVFSLKTPS